MLVLSRKTGERINIGDDIVIEVRRVAGNRVTLAMEAPRSVRILRGELLEAANAFEKPATAERVDEPKAAAAPEPYIVTHQRFVAADSQSHTVS